MGIIVGAAVAAVSGAGTWTLHLRQQRRIEALEGRLASLTAGISLLTDTTETGLRDIAHEIGRQSSGASAPRPRSRAATHRRITGAARRGQSVQEIAASEQVSEGEVTLRLSLATSEEPRAALR